jgi:large subunit ribosomal protein L2
MFFKKISPRTPSQRNLIQIINIFSKNKPLLKNQIKGSKNTAGRNNTGKITIFNRGGGHKKKYRKIQFKRNKNTVGIVINIEYDPNRNSFIAAIYDSLIQKYYYILSPNKLKIGDIVKSGTNSELKLGHSIPLTRISVGTAIHNVANRINQKGIFSRSAGTSAILIEKNNKFGRVELSSGEHRFIPINCMATLGTVSNEDQFLTTIGKAGRSRWLNKRPKVRGVAMNPIDHPHGGGEGKTSGNKIHLTPWGFPTKGRKTKKFNNKLIITNRK